MKIDNLITCGIYKLQNNITGDVYVGQSASIIARLGGHIIKLNLNNHRNWLLQESWNKYGAKNFFFEVLEECDYNKLDERENYWISQLASFNIIINGMRKIGVREETRQRMSLSRLEGFKNGTIVPYQYKTIYQYGLDGTFIKEHFSIVEASKETGASPPKIVRAAKTYITTGGFMWRYYKEDSIPPYKRKKYNYNKGLLKSDKLLENPEEDNQQPS